MPLRRVLLEYLLRGFVDAESPGTAELIGLIVGGHPVQEIVWIDSFIYDYLGQTCRHRNRHFDVQGHFAVARPGNSVKFIQQHIRHRDIRQPRLKFVSKDVIQVVAVKFKQSDCLAQPRKRTPGA